MKYVKDFDNDNINDYLIFRHNKLKDNFDQIELILSKYGTLEFTVKSEFEYLRKYFDIIQSEKEWDEMRFDYFWGFKKNKTQYLFFSEPDTDSILGMKTFIIIDTSECKVVFNKPFTISKILADNLTINVFGKNSLQTCFNDTIIDNRKYKICDYVPILCYSLGSKDSIDYEKSIAYNLSFNVGWAVSDKRKTLIDKSTKKEKFLFETYRKYPETSLKYLSEKDLLIYTKEELKYMRNEIFADYGYIFRSELLDWHFSNFDWYKKEDREVNNDLSQIELENIKLIKKIEEK